MEQELAQIQTGWKSMTPAARAAVLTVLEMILREDALKSNAVAVRTEHFLHMTTTVLNAHARRMTVAAPDGAGVSDDVPPRPAGVQMGHSANRRPSVHVLR